MWRELVTAWRQTMQRLVKVWPLGRIGYCRALKIQKYLADLHHSNQASNQICDTILLLEHPPVYTIGIRAKNYTVEYENNLKKTGAEFYRTNRGGLITFHGPGQLVIYPILNLKNYKTSMRWFVEHIEKTVIHFCKQLGLNAHTTPYTGVWINDNKICAIGIHGSRYVTTHGLAINCNTDLKWYEHIVPCGIEDKGVTSLSNELGKSVFIDDIVPVFLNSFSEMFQCCYTNFPLDDQEKITNDI